MPGGHAEGHQLLVNGIRPQVAQRQVGATGANRIGVSHDLNVAARVRYEKDRHDVDLVVLIAPWGMGPRVEVDDAGKYRSEQAGREMLPDGFRRAIGYRGADRRC